MWYVIQTVGGQEQAVRRLIEHQLSGAGDSLVDQCFIPMRERTVKRGGEWQLVQEKLFPGYVFVVTEDAQKLLQNLKSIPRFTRLLGTGANEFVPLRPEEIAFLQKFEDSGHVARLSKAEVVEGGRIRILSGALLNCEGMITKVHLHKRVAEVRMQFMGRTVDLYLGFDLLGRPRIPENEDNTSEGLGKRIEQG